LTKHTLYITFDGLTDPLGQSQILPYLQGLSANGYHISVLSCEKKERINKESQNIHAALQHTNITWNYIIYDEVGSFLSRLQYIRKIYSLAKKAHVQKNFKVVHCRSYLSALIGLRLKRKYKIPFLFDMRGFWADERIDGNIWNVRKILHRAFYKFFKKKEKQFLSESDAIVSLTHAAVKELEKNNQQAGIANKITVIPCCVNTSLFDPAQVTTKNIFKNISPADHLLIYTGSVGTWYYTKEMIDCVLEWRKILPAIKLLVVTKDIKELENILQQYSPAERSPIVYASASYQEMPSLLSLAKASIFFIKPAYSKIASSPTKMAECWAMGLPIITNNGIGDNDMYFNDLGGGILVNAFSKEAYIAAGKKYLALNPDPQHYRRLALAHFNTLRAVELYTLIYNSLVNR
jgi:glycosyltransferase involved in cell wall biosynthesis